MTIPACTLGLKACVASDTFMHIRWFPNIKCLVFWVSSRYRALEYTRGTPVFGNSVYHQGTSGHSIVI